MNMKELYHKFREQGKSVGHALWCAGYYCLYGKEGVEIDLDKAEECFLRAWDHNFPGIPSTQEFILIRQWQKFITRTYPEMPRMLALLSEADASSEERNGIIHIPVHNDAQKKWIDDRAKEMAVAFSQFLGDRFFSITVQAEVRP